MTPEGVIAGQKTRPTEPPLVYRKHIAHMNTLAMIRAQEQLYSPVADFGWLDEMGKYQSDWKPFSKEKILASVPA